MNDERTINDIMIRINKDWHGELNYEIFYGGIVSGYPNRESFMEDVIKFIEEREMKE